jgi:outer membrane protein OmpU
MKKQLLTTTALVAAGAIAFSGAALAKRPTLTVGGYAAQIIGIGSNDAAFDEANNQRIGFDQHSDGEVHFNGSVTLDNGIRIRTRVELESNSEPSVQGGGGVNGAAAAGNMDTIDEHWMRISGTFGELRFGSMDAAGQTMTTGYLGTWGTGVGQLLAFDTGDWITSPGTVSSSTVGRVDLSSDAENVSYYTPRMSGFQLGVSFVPSTQEDVNNQRSTSAAGDTDGWSFGANYVGKFGGANIGVAAGYAFANESTVDRDDPNVWAVAGRVDVGPIRVQASWHERDDQKAISTGLTAAAGQETFEAGVRYLTGPNAFSLTFLSAETTGTIGATTADETEVMAVAYRRTLGPGVTWHVTAMFADHNDGAAGAIASASNSGEALTTHMTVRF